MGKRIVYKKLYACYESYEREVWLPWFQEEDRPPKNSPDQ